jgi:hypothetical protein
MVTERPYINKITYTIIMLAMVMFSCTKPYNPPAIKNVTGYLVVEGVINSGSDSTKFTLSRTVGLDSASTVNPVTGAKVTVEGNDNSSYPLTGNSAGVYTSVPLNLDNSKEYRLDIKTTDGKQYLSDYVPVKVTPAIDSVSYALEGNGVQLNVSTHDPANNTHYYRWDYVSNGDTILARTPAQQVYYCYTNDNATNILLGTSAKLTQDIIAPTPVTFVPSTSEKLEMEYSIIVRQYALTSDAYNFWTNLKTNTEELGSIFDALPSEINGNIHCITDPSEPVIGYISVSTITSKRIFIYNSSLSLLWTSTYPYTCMLNLYLYNFTEYGGDINQVNEYLNYGRGAPPGNWIPTEPDDTLLANGTIKTLGFLATEPVCGDCTLRGTVIKPNFWQ